MTTDDMGLVASGISVWAADGRSLVDDVTIQARAGHTLVIVGESGAGKSMLARTICALTPHSLRAQGRVALQGREYDIVRNARAFKNLRGQGIVWLPQDPFTSLSPRLLPGSVFLSVNVASGSGSVCVKSVFPSESPEPIRMNSPVACANALPLRLHWILLPRSLSPTNQQPHWT